MARQVTVQLTVDSKGAVQGIEAVNGQLMDLSEVSERVGSDLRSSFSDLQSRAALAESGLEGVTIQAQQAAQASRQMAGGGQRANLVLMQFGQAAQDAAFGIQFAVNNMPMLLDNFQRMSQEAGGARAALGQIGNAVTGFGAAILAINLIPLLGRLAERMNLFGEETAEASEEVEEAEKRLRGLAGELINLEEVRAAQLQQITEEDLPRMLSLQAGRLNTAQAELETLQERRETIMDEAIATQSLNQQESRRLSSLDLQIQRQQQQVNNQQALFDQINEQYQRVLDLTALSEDLQQIGADRQETEEQIEAAVRGEEQAFSLVGQAMEFLLRDADNFLQSTGQTEDAMRQILGHFHDLEQQIPTVEEGFDTFHNRLKEQLDLSIEGAEEVNEEVKPLENFDATALIMGASALGQMAAGAKEAGQAVQDLVANLARAAGASLIQAGRFEIGIPLLLGGEIIGAFEQGGRVNTPFQVVGEGGPELATMPQGTRVHSNQESRQIISDSLRGMIGGGARQPKRIHLTGTFRQEGTDMVATIDETRRLDNRQGL